MGERGDQNLGCGRILSRKKKTRREDRDRVQTRALLVKKKGGRGAQEEFNNARDDWTRQGGAGKDTNQNEVRLNMNPRSIQKIQSPAERRNMMKGKSKTTMARIG